MAVSVLDAFTSTNNADPSGSVTISAGSNRCAMLGLHAENASTIVVSTMTIGGQAATQSYAFWQADGVIDMFMYVYLWDEAAIAAMSGTGISYVDDQTLTNRGWTFGTYQGVNQSVFPKGQAEVGQISNQASNDIATVSNSGDRSIVFAMSKSPNFGYTSWDTLSEVVDIGPTDMRAAVGEGSGGDDTTTVVLGGAASQALNAIVLGADTGIQTHAMYHYMNHGKIF